MLATDVKMGIVIGAAAALGAGGLVAFKAIEDHVWQPRFKGDERIQWGAGDRGTETALIGEQLLGRHFDSLHDAATAARSVHNDLPHIILSRTGLSNNSRYYVSDVDGSLWNALPTSGRPGLDINRNELRNFSGGRNDETSYESFVQLGGQLYQEVQEVRVTGDARRFVSVGAFE